MINQETKINSFYTIVSGLFIYNSESVDNQALFNNYNWWWNRIDNGQFEATFNYLNHSYYDSYLDNIFPEIRGKNNECENLDSKYLNHLTFNKKDENANVFENLKLQINSENQIDFIIKYIDLYLFPHNIGIFSIKCNLFNSNDLHLGKVSNFLNQIRFLSSIVHINSQKLSIKEFIEQNLLNSLNLNKDWDIYNPQLKTYNSIDLYADFPTKELDYLLYDIGNMSAIGSAKGDGFFAPSESYYKEQLEENKISIFKNWAALSLFDTFTRISIDFPDKFKSWEYDYFHIYIYYLNLRFYLYQINSKLRSTKNSGIKANELRKNYLEFLSYNNFNNISYKFLPDAIKAKIVKAFEIDEEIRDMEHKIEKSNIVFNEQKSRKTNLMLIFISVLGIFSVNYHFSSWLIEMGIRKSKVYPYISFFVLFSLLGLIALFNLRKIKK